MKYEMVKWSCSGYIGQLIHQPIVSTTKATCRLMVKDFCFQLICQKWLSLCLSSIWNAPTANIRRLFFLLQDLIYSFYHSHKLHMFVTFKQRLLSFPIENCDIVSHLSWNIDVTWCDLMWLLHKCEHSNDNLKASNDWMPFWIYS